MSPSAGDRRPLCAALAAVAIALVCTPATASIEWRSLALPGGADLRYALVLPDDEPAGASRARPALLALPPGAEDEAMVDWALRTYWGAAAAAAGWVVVCPVAPPGGWDASAGKRAALELMRAVARDVRIEGGRFHLAGISNGGASAFHLAADLPERFLSLTVLPGIPRGRGEFRRLARLGALPVRIFVGADDAGWVDGARRTADRLRQLGTPVELSVLPGEGHVLETLAGGELFRRLEAARPTPASTE